MHYLNIYFTIIVVTVYSVPDSSQKLTDESSAIQFLQKYDKEASYHRNYDAKAQWNYETNITDYNQRQALIASDKLSGFFGSSTQQALQFDTSNMSYNVQRQMKFLIEQQLPSQQMSNLSNILSQMAKIYAEGEVCKDGNLKDCLQLEPGLTEIMAKSRNYAELVWAWEGWRNNVGRAMKPLYPQYVELKNALARANGYGDYGEQLTEPYDSKTFEEDMLHLYEQVKPYYEELHAYIRRRLHDLYGDEVIDLTGPIQACLLGDMWGRFWNNIYPIVVTFPEAGSVDPTPQMIAKGYTELNLFELGDDFYRSMGLLGVPDTFYNNSMLIKPKDRNVACHPTSWDFFDGKDMRIKMCTEVNFDNFLTVHHELGHIQYFMQYATQPVLYRDGANNGFHEAIGELMAMSVSTPKHLYTMGLMESDESNEKLEVNYLLMQSLTSLSTLPFHLVNDLWRWRVYRGEIPVHKWNEEFWKLKFEFVGVKPPVPRSSDDLDPPALFHISNDFDMIRYFTRTIMQYQFAQALCDAAEQRGPLHRCDIYGSKRAGKSLAAMLQMGRSRPWQDAMEVLTGQREMLSEAILSYYKPLYEYLKKENEKNGDGVGWGETYRTRESLRKSNRNKFINHKMSLKKKIQKTI